MRISFEIDTKADDDGGVQVEIYLDREGRDTLVKYLSRLNAELHTALRKNGEILARTLPAM